MILLFLTLTNINAQKEQKKETTTTYTMNIETMDGITIPYKITVFETRKSKIKFAKEDIGKIDKTRIYTPDYVTKIIYIDKGADVYIITARSSKAGISFPGIEADHIIATGSNKAKIEKVIELDMFTDNLPHMAAGFLREIENDSEWPHAPVQEDQL